MDTFIETNKRTVHDEVYAVLTAIQQKYNEIAHDFTKQSAGLIPKSSADIEKLDQLEENSRVVHDHMARLEYVKMMTSMIILTDGVATSIEEVSEAIEQIEELINISEIEKTVGEKPVVDWANTKIVRFVEIKEILLQILTHKMEAKHHFGKLEIH